jgi:hypothetical protein
MGDQEEHTPHRPDWLCRTCGQEWPCAPAKVQLGEQYAPRRRIELALYMAAQLQDALAELPDPGPSRAELQTRFMAWTRIGLH